MEPTPYGEWLTTAEARDAVGCSLGYLRKLEQRGIIKQIIRGKQGYFTREDVDRAKAEHQKWLDSKAKREG
jgi:hypothetical protein